MKKQDILDSMQSKFTLVLGLSHVEQLGVVRWYVANVLDAESSHATKRSVGFYVVNEGTPSEIAYWQGREPKPSLPDLTFEQQVQERIGVLRATGVIEGGSLKHIDVVNKTAVVTIWSKSSADLLEKTFFIDRDPTGGWRHREVKGV